MECHQSMKRIIKFRYFVQLQPLPIIVTLQLLQLLST